MIVTGTSGTGAPAAAPSLPRTARERARAEVTREILEASRRHLVTEGAGGLSLRAVARDLGVEALVNMSQMTVSEMDVRHTTPSRQQRQHWLGEQALAWSGLPVVTVRPTMFLETFLPLAGPTVRDRRRIELPFGRGKTSPVAAADIARVVAALLADPGPHLGRVYELTGPRSQDLHGIAREFSDALKREVVYADIAPEDWEAGLKRQGVPEHLTTRGAAIVWQGGPLHFPVLTSNPHIEVRANTLYRVRIIREPRRLTLFVNGVEAASAVVPVPPRSLQIRPSTQRSPTTWSRV